MENNMHIMPARNTRLGYIDSVKGIGILLVIVGHHINGGQVLFSWINSFHMPLFFLVTGWLDGIRTEDATPGRNPWDYIRKKAKVLLWPYVTFSAVNLLWLVAYHLTLGVQPEEALSVVLLKTITTYGYRALWFLPAMFLASLIHHSAGRSAPKRTLIVSLTLGSGIALYLNHFADTGFLRHVLIYISRVSMGVSFIGLGNVFCRLVNQFKRSRALIIAGICFIVHFLLFRLVPPLNMSTAHMTNIPLHYLLGCTCSICVILLCKHIPVLSNNRLLAWVSQNSLIILALHMDFPIELAWMVLGTTGVSTMLSPFPASVVAVGIECLILWGCIILIRKYLPFLLHFPGKKITG